MFNYNYSAGHYCPIGTGSNAKKCPSGSYGALKGLSKEDECTACDGGHFCKDPGGHNVSGECKEGGPFF